MLEKNKSLSAVGFPNYYITESGKVYSKSYGRFLKSFKLPFGKDKREMVRLYNDGENQTFCVERLRIQLFPTFWEKVQKFFKNITK